MPFSWRVPMWVMESVASSAIYKEKPAAIVTAGFSCGIDVRGKFGFCLQRYWLLGNATRAGRGCGRPSSIIIDCQ